MKSTSKIDTTELARHLQVFFEAQNQYKEITKEEILNDLEEYKKLGMAGAITRKNWSPKYAGMNCNSLKKYIKELPNDCDIPLNPKVINTYVNVSNKGCSVKRIDLNAIANSALFYYQKERLPFSRVQEIKALRRPRSTQPKKKYIVRDQVDLLINNIENNTHLEKFPNGKKVFILAIEIAYEQGLRISEICSIKISDIDFDKQELFIPKAKGNKSFTKGFNSRLKNLLQDYLKVRPKVENLNLLILDTGLPLTSDTLMQRFRRLTKKLGIDTSFHAFRRNYITRHLQDGKSLVDVSLAVNHSSPRMTEQYLIPDVQRSIKEQKSW